MCNKGITQFYLPPTHKPYLPLLPNRKDGQAEVTWVADNIPI